MFYNREAVIEEVGYLRVEIARRSGLVLRGKKRNHSFFEGEISGSSGNYN